MNTQTYNNAVNSIRTFAEEKQAELDKAALTARQANIAAHRAAALEEVDPNSPEYSICTLVAQTLSIGQEDDYPAFRIPEETRKVLLAARTAELLKTNPSGYVCVGRLRFFSDCSRVIDSLEEQGIDCKAWMKAHSYRKSQNYQTL